MREQVGGDVDNAFDAWIDHFLPRSEARRRRLLLCRDGDTWQFELWVDDARAFTVTAPLRVAQYFGVVLHLINTNEPGAAFLSKLPAVAVTALPTGYSVSRHD